MPILLVKTDNQERVQPHNSQAAERLFQPKPIEVQILLPIRTTPDSVLESAA